MYDFQKIKEAILYIDNHLDESISYESIAKRFNFSPYYFHRMFSAIVSKTITAHIRDRRLLSACMQLSKTNNTITDVCFNCGYNSTQSFSRAFKAAYGISPSEYRRQGLFPAEISIDEMIMKFTNRLKGGIIVLNFMTGGLTEMRQALLWRYGFL